MAITTAQRTAIFGQPGQVDLVTYVTPWRLKVRIHPQIQARFKAACERAHATVKWTPLRIDSYANRSIRGSTSPSLHSYGLAVDIFATPPDVVPPGGVWTPDDEMPPDFVRCFTDLGFRWGGTFKRRDTPHIEWADGKPAPLTDTPPPPLEDDMPPAPAVVYVNSQRYVFVRGTNAELYMISPDKSQHSFKGVLTSSPSAAASPSGVTVTARGQDGATWVIDIDPARATVTEGWRSLGGKS